MTLLLLSRTQALMRTALRPLLDPARRYRHARLIHAVRVALGLLASIVLTTGMQLPHGEWASITLLVVIGGLQHHGNIRRKAAERAVGTLIGAASGLAVILQQSWLQMPLLSYFLVVAACGFCAYHAIGKGGYVALLSAITILIVAGHGENAIADGLWRSVNVLVGIAIALLFSFALPLHATYSWRYQVAEILRSCARMYAVTCSDAAAIDSAAMQQAMALQGTLLVQLRSLMPSVAKETGIPMAQLEQVQHSLRIGISLLEVLAAARPLLVDDEAQQFIRHRLASEHRRLRELLHGMARALKSGIIADLAPRAKTRQEQLADPAPAPLAAYVSLTRQLASEFEQLQQRLAALADRWNV